MKSGPRIVMITGASSGLGRALAEKLAGPDTLLILTGREEKDMVPVAEAVRHAGGVAEVRAFDIREYNAVAACIDDVASRHGTLDVLVNNAGWAHAKTPIEDLSLDDYRQTIATNLDGVFFCIKKALPIMKKNGRGLIVNIASLAGKRGHGGLGDYSASKFAVIGLTQSVGWEIHDADLPDLRIVAVCPGGINTPMRRKIFGAEDADRQQVAEDVADIVAQIVNGTLAVPNGGDVAIVGGAVKEIADPLGSSAKK